MLFHYIKNKKKIQGIRTKAIEKHKIIAKAIVYIKYETDY